MLNPSFHDPKFITTMYITTGNPKGYWTGQLPHLILQELTMTDDRQGLCPIAVISKARPLGRRPLRAWMPRLSMQAATVPATRTVRRQTLGPQCRV
jgi:hypothetical protein